MSIKYLSKCITWKKTSTCLKLTFKHYKQSNQNYYLYSILKFDRKPLNQWDSIRYTLMVVRKIVDKSNFIFSNEYTIFCQNFSIRFIEIPLLQSYLITCMSSLIRFIFFSQFFKLMKWFWNRVYINGGTFFINIESVFNTYYKFIFMDFLT